MFLTDGSARTFSVLSVLRTWQGGRCEGESDGENASGAASDIGSARWTSNVGWMARASGSWLVVCKNRQMQELADLFSHGDTGLALQTFARSSCGS